VLVGWGVRARVVRCNTHCGMQRPTPSPATDAGFLYGRKEYKAGVLEKLIQRSPDDPKLTEEQQLVQNAAIVAEKELLAMQRITQIFVVRCVGFFLFSVALFNVLAFFEASTTQERVPCALSIVVNLVAAMHYRTIAWIRMDSSLTLTLSAYATDATRYGEWLVNTARAHACAHARLTLLLHRR